MKQEELQMQEESLPPVPKASGAANSLFDILEMFAWSLFVVFMLFTFAIRLCDVEGASMENTLYDNQKLLLYNVAYTPQQDDIIVFCPFNAENETMHQKTLVKRVIATGGQELTINFDTQEIFVDGVKYADSHAVFKNSVTGALTDGYTGDSGIYTVTVPDNMLFVMGDNRNNSLDSRRSDIGFVDARGVLGKVVLRLAPFTVFP